MLQVAQFAVFSLINSIYISIMWAERTVVELWTTWCIMKVEGFKKLAVLLYATRLGHLPYRATFSLFNMRTCWGIIEDAYWLLDNATHYFSYRLVRKLRTAQYIVLAYTAFCVNSLKYYIFYLIWYMITFVIPFFIRMNHLLTDIFAFSQPPLDHLQMILVAKILLLR